MELIHTIRETHYSSTSPPINQLHVYTVNQKVVNIKVS